MGGVRLQEGFEFTEELLHKENVQHLQGDGTFQMKLVLSALIWFLNHSVTQTVFNVDFIHSCSILSLKFKLDVKVADSHSSMSVGACMCDCVIQTG